MSSLSTRQDAADAPEDEDIERPLTVLEEARDILLLFVPLFFSSLSWVAMKTTDTALLGHAGTKYLEASSLSDLWTSSTGVIIQGRVLGMFVGNSIATNPKMAGEWLQVSKRHSGSISRQLVVEQRHLA